MPEFNLSYKEMRNILNRLKNDKSNTITAEAKILEASHYKLLYALVKETNQKECIDLSEIILRNEGERTEKFRNLLDSCRKDHNEAIKLSDRILNSNIPLVTEEMKTSRAYLTLILKITLTPKEFADRHATKKIGRPKGKPNTTKSSARKSIRRPKKTQSPEYPNSTYNDYQTSTHDEYHKDSFLKFNGKQVI